MVDCLARAMVGRAGGSEEGVLAKDELPSLVSCTTVNDSREVLDIRRHLMQLGMLLQADESASRRWSREQTSSVG